MNSGRTWFLFCHDYLVSLGFTQSQVDPCVFYYHTDAVLLLFVDNVILGACTRSGTYSDVIQLLQDNVDVNDQDDLCNYLGVHVTPVSGGLKFSQPQLIDSISHDLSLTTASKALATPAVASKPLHACGSSRTASRQLVQLPCCGGKAQATIWRNPPDLIWHMLCINGCA